MERRIEQEEGSNETLAIDEMIIPVDTVLNEVFRFADEFSRFTFGWTCHYFRDKKRNSAVSLPLIEVFFEIVRVGRLEELQFWFNGKIRPRNIAFCNAAAFYGRVDILEWLKVGRSLADNSFLLHAILNHQDEAMRYLVEQGCMADFDIIKAAQPRVSADMLAYLKTTFRRDATHLKRTDTANPLYCYPPGGLKFLHLSEESAVPSSFLIRLLIEENAISVGSDSIESLMNMGDWWSAKEIILMLESRIMTRPDQGKVRGKTIYKREVLVCSVSKYLDSLSRADLIEWFLDKDLIDFSIVKLNPLVDKHGWGIPKRAFLNGLLYSKKTELLSIVIAKADMETVEFFARNDLFSSFDPRLHVAIAKDSFRSYVLEWLVFESPKPITVTDDFVGCLFSSGVTSIFRRLVPTVVSHMRREMTRHVTLTTFASGMWECFMHAISVGAMSLDSFQEYDILNSIPVEHFLSLLDMKKITWDDCLASEIARYPYPRFDILVAMAEKGAVLASDIIDFIERAAPRLYVSKLIDLGIIHWEMSNTVEAVRNRRIPVALMGLELIPPTEDIALFLAKMALDQRSIELLRSLIALVPTIVPQIDVMESISNEIVTSQFLKELLEIKFPKFQAKDAFLLALQNDFPEIMEYLLTNNQISITAYQFISKLRRVESSFISETSRTNKAILLALEAVEEAQKASALISFMDRLFESEVSASYAFNHLIETYNFEIISSANGVPSIWFQLPSSKERCKYQPKLSPGTVHSFSKKVETFHSLIKAARARKSVKPSSFHDDSFTFEPTPGGIFSLPPTDASDSRVGFSLDDSQSPIPPNNSILKKRGLEYDPSNHLSSPSSVPFTFRPLDSPLSSSSTTSQADSFAFGDDKVSSESTKPVKANRRKAPSSLSSSNPDPNPFNFEDPFNFNPH